MTPELIALTLAALLQGVQLFFTGLALNLEKGVKFALSSRDEGKGQLSPKTGRLTRALNNHFEGLILFTIACVVVHLSGSSSAVTSGCAYMYLAARVLYVPVYYFGLVPWRSVVWGFGFGATIIMLIAALL